jgi:hypothetical protein
VSTALQRYADRGVFRGFKADARPGGRLDFTFTWLTRRPFSARFDARSNALTFRSLFPGLAPRPDIAGALRAVVDSRTGRGIPAHKRLDARRAVLTWSVRRGDAWLRVAIRGAHHEYAVRHVLNLINELFLALQETYPDYLIEHFGLSSE